MTVQVPRQANHAWTALFLSLRSEIHSQFICSPWYTSKFKASSKLAYCSRSLAKSRSTLYKSINIKVKWWEAFKIPEVGPHPVVQCLARSEMMPRSSLCTCSIIYGEAQKQVGGCGGMLKFRGSHVALWLFLGIGIATDLESGVFWNWWLW